jgi:hypothetical protein
MFISYDVHFITIHLVTGQAVYVWRNIEASSCNHCCSGKATSVTYAECVFVALGIQYEMHVRHIVICGLFVSTNIFPRCLQKTRFSKRRKKKKNLKCVLWFSTQRLSETFLILRRTERDMIKKNVYWSLCTLAVILVRFEWNLNFLDRFSKNTHISNFMEAKPSGGRVVPCGRTDKRADMTKLIVAFRNFANSPKSVLTIATP